MLMVTVKDHGKLLKPQTIRDGRVEDLFVDKKQEEFGVLGERMKGIDENDWANLANFFEGATFEEKLTKYKEAIKRK